MKEIEIIITVLINLKFIPGYLFFVFVGHLNINNRNRDTQNRIAFLHCESLI